MRIEINLETNKILELEDAPIIDRSKQDIEIEELQVKVGSYIQYLRDTDWIKSYLLEHKLGISIIPEDSSKWLIINTRQYYIDFLKGL